MDTIHEILTGSSNILITSHLNPDPDAICSSLGMLDYILKTYPNKNVECLLNGTKLESYNSLKNYDRIKWVNELTDNLEKFDTIVFVDASDLTRFTDVPDKLDLSKFKTICIDHHKNAVANFNVSIVETSEPSASQIIYKYFFKGKNILDPYIAEVFLVGILSDTGMLKFVRETSLHTFDYVKELIEISDLDLGQVEQKYFTFSLTDWEIIQELTRNIVKVDDLKFPFIYSYLPMEYIHKYPANITKQGKAKFLMLFGTSIQGYSWGFVATPDDDNFMNISFRSTPGSVNVRLIANQFGGGGHDLASGGEININPGESSQEVSKRIADNIKNITIETVNI